MTQEVFTPALARPDAEVSDEVVSTRINEEFGYVFAIRRTENGSFYGEMTNPKVWKFEDPDALSDLANGYTRLMSWLDECGDQLRELLGLRPEVYASVQPGGNIHTGRTLKQIREAAELSVDDAARMLDTEPEFIEQVESGEVTLTRSGIGRYTRAYASALGGDVR